MFKGLVNVWKIIYASIDPKQQKDVCSSTLQHPSSKVRMATGSDTSTLDIAQQRHPAAAPPLRLQSAHKPLFLYLKQEPQ